MVGLPADVGVVCRTFSAVGLGGDFYLVRFGRNLPLEYCNELGWISSDE
jgi:hypothetical protein